MTKQILSQEALLATEELQEQTIKAQSGSAEEFEKFTENTEDKAIAERKEKQEGDGEPETPDADITGDTPEAEDEPVEGGIPEDEEVITTEALPDWIREKTSNSNSFVSGAGSVVAGLAELGITYGPSTLQYLQKGTLWAFSRLGSLIHDTGSFLSGYIEKSMNSIGKLDARLKAAEAAIITGANEGKSIPSFSYTNKKVIGYLKVGKNLGVADNLKNYANQLEKTTSAISNEFENGYTVVDRIAKSDFRSKVTSVKDVLEVSAPKTGFVKGSVKGYKNDESLVTQYHTTPVWPGDAVLIFDIPKVDSDDMAKIHKAYSAASMYMAVSIDSSSIIDKMASLNTTELIMVAKSIKSLLNACRVVTKSHENMHRLQPNMATSIKRVFFKLADEAVKISMKDSMMEPLYLRSSLASSVYVKGSTSALTHASRVAAAAIKLLEDHASKLSVKA